MSPYVRQLLDQSLFDPMADFAGCQGKRIRGSLLQLSYEMSGGVGQVSPAISEAIESLHGGSLVIDDIQDDSQKRRGQQTMHHRIGIPLAINAGNWMYFHALECLGNAQLPMEQQWRLVSAMIRAARQCHEGQAIDLHARIDRVPTPHWREATLAISTLKTGSLVALAVEMGCTAADCNSALSGVLNQFGRQIGIALQMRNDLDELSTIARNPYQSAAIDAVRDDDLRNARLTWPWVWAHEQHGDEPCRSLVRRLVLSRLVQSRRDRRATAIELFELSGSHGDQVIRSLVQDQLCLLGEHIVDRRWLDSLGEILEPIARPVGTAHVAPCPLTSSTVRPVTR